MIHNNCELTDIDRVHYLIGCLTGSALSVCSGIAPTGDNYRIIFQALKDKFEDKRVIANTFLDQLFNFKQAQHENATTLNLFLEKFHPAVTALRQLDIPDLSDYILAYLAFQKINPETQRLFENTRRSSEMPSYNDILTFVKEQAKICTRTSSGLKSNSSNNKNNSSIHSNRQLNNSKTRVTHSFVVQGNSSSYNCVICKENSHSILICPKFLELSPEKRYRVVRENNLCLNCLSRHKVINCKSNYTCRICQRKHHSLLHFKSSMQSIANSVGKSDQPISSNSETNGPNVSEICKNSTAGPSSSTLNKNGGTSMEYPLPPLVNCCSVTHSHKNSSSSNTVLLSTAKVHVLDSFGNFHDARFLIDSGSQANFLSLEFSRRLKCPLTKCHSHVYGIGSASSSVYGCSTIVVISRVDTTKRYPLEVLIVDKIADQLPASRVDLSALSHLKSLPLADGSFHFPSGSR